MSRTLRILAAPLMACLVLTVGGCGGDKPQASTENKSSISTDPGSKETGISPKEDKEWEKQERRMAQKERRSFISAKRSLRVAVDRAEGATGKVRAVINLACRRTYTSISDEVRLDDNSVDFVDPDAKYFRLYSSEYKKQWYPDQLVVAYPFSMRRAMQRACPDSFTFGDMQGG